MATTTGGTTYVTSTDLVANYPTASLALANRVDVVASGGPVLVKTAGYTITVADILGGNKFLYNSASPGTFTFPTASLVDGMVIQVAQIGAGALTVTGGTIVGTTVTTAQYQSLTYVYVASGTTWYSVAPPSAAPGMSIVAPTTIQNTTGSATASGGEVTFTGVSSVSLNGVFTGTYDSYLLMARFTAASVTNVGQFRLRVGGVDNAGAGVYQYQGVYNGGTVGATNTLLPINSVDSTSPWTFSQIEVSLPAQAVQTVCLYQSAYVSGASRYAEYGSMMHNVATAYDGFSLIASTGTFTGKVRVYGLKNS